MEAKLKSVGVIVLLIWAASVQGYEWASRYNGGYGGDEAAAIVLSGANVPFVAGSSRVADGSEDWVTMRLDPNTGSVHATTYHYLSYTGEQCDDQACALAHTASGYTYVVGLTEDTIRVDTLDVYSQYTVVRYDSTLSTPLSVWRYQIESDEMEGVAASVVAVGDTVYATGSSFTTSNGLDVLTTKHLPGGAVGSRFRDIGNDDDEGYAIAADAQGGIYVAGGTFTSSQGYDILVVKYAGNTFSRRWDVLDSGAALGGYDEAVAAATSPDGDVYVACGSASGAPGSDIDILTIKYDSTGQMLWSRRYNGPGNGNDRARAMTTDLSASIYVTGASDSAGEMRGRYPYSAPQARQW